MKKEGVYLSVATNAPTVFAKTMLSHLGVAKFFDLIVGADRVHASKPNPAMLNYILSHYDYNAMKDSAWMIGDNSKDMQSAANAHIKSIFAAWGFSASAEHPTVVKNPKEVLENV